MDLTSTSQTEADKLETESTLNFTEKLLTNAENNTENILQQHNEASGEHDNAIPNAIENTIHGSDTTSEEETCLHKKESNTPEEIQDGSGIEAKENEYEASEASEVEIEQFVHEVQFSDSQSVGADTSVETGADKPSEHDQSLSSESSKKDIDDLAISPVTDKEILPVQVGEDYNEASHVESENSEKTLESMIQVLYSEVPDKVQENAMKEESLAAATPEFGVEKIPNEGTSEAKGTLDNVISSEKIGDEDSHFDPSEKEIIQEELPSIPAHVISETAMSDKQSEVSRDQESTDEDGVVKGIQDDSSTENMLNRSLGEEETERECTDEAAKELNLQEDADELDYGHTKTENKCSNEEVSSSEVVFLQQCKDRGVHDQEYSIEEKSQPHNENINDSSVVDIPGAEGVGTTILESEHGGALDISNKDLEKNKESSTAVETNKEVADAADNNTLESLRDHEKPDTKPVETACEEKEAKEKSQPTEKAEDKELKTDDAKDEEEEEEGEVQKGEYSASEATPTVERDPVDVRSNKIIADVEIKEGSSAILDRKNPEQGDPEERIATVISSDNKEIQSDSLTGTVGLEIDELKHVDSSEAAESNENKEETEDNEDQATTCFEAAIRVPTDEVTENNEDQATVATRESETMGDEVGSQSSIPEGEDKEIHYPDVKLESLSPPEESSADICHVDDPLDLAKPTDIAPDITEQNQASHAAKEIEIPEEPQPNDSTEGVIQCVDEDAELLQNDPAVTIIQDEIQKLEILNPASEAAKVEADEKEASDKLAEDHVSEQVNNSNMRIVQDEDHVDLSSNKNITEEMNDACSESGNCISVQKDSEEAIEPVISSEEKETLLEPVSTKGTVTREIEELVPANVSEVVGEADPKVSKDPKNSMSDKDVPHMEEEATYEIFQAGEEIPRCAEQSSIETKSEEEEGVTDEIKEATEKSLSSEAANASASALETPQSTEHLSETRKQIAGKEELQTVYAARDEHRELKTEGAKDEDEEREVQRGENSCLEVPLTVESDPVEGVRNKINAEEEIKEDSTSAIPDRTISEQRDPEESIETMLPSEDKHIQSDSLTGTVGLEIDELKHVGYSEAIGSNKFEEAKENNEDQAIDSSGAAGSNENEETKEIDDDQATIETRGSETKQDEADTQSSITEGENVKVHVPDVKLESLSPPDQSNTGTCQIDEHLYLTKPTEIATESIELQQVSLATRETGILEEPHTIESTEVTIVSAGKDVQLLQKEPEATSIQDEIQKLKTENYQDAASEAETVESEARGTTAESKEKEQESTSINQPNSFQQDFVQGSVKATLSVGEEALDQLPEDHVPEHVNDHVDLSSNKNIRVEVNDGSPCVVSGNNILVQEDLGEGKKPVTSSEEKDMFLVQPVSMMGTVMHEIDELIHANASEADAEAESVGGGEGTETRECLEEQGTIHDYNQILETSQLMESTKNAPPHLLQGSADEKEQRITDETKEVTGKSLPTGADDTSGSASETLEIVSPEIAEQISGRSKEIAREEKLQTENVERAENKELKTDETKDEEEERKVQREEDSYSEVPVIIERDIVEGISSKIFAEAEIKENNCSGVLDRKNPEQRDPEESIETVISSEDKHIQSDSVTGIVGVEIDELKDADSCEGAGRNKSEEAKENNEDEAADSSEAAGSNTNEEPKQKIEDQAICETRGTETTQDEAVIQSCITEGEEMSIHVPDVKLESLSPPEQSSKNMYNIDEPLDLAKPIEMAPSGESTDVRITSLEKDVQLLQKDDIQKLEIENVFNAATGAATEDSEATGTTEESKKIEQESTSTKTTINPKSDLVQGYTDQTLFVAEERETLDQLAPNGEEEQIITDGINEATGKSLATKIVKTDEAKDEVQGEAQGGENSGSEVPLTVEKDPVDLTNNKTITAVDSEESKETLISSEDRDTGSILVTRAVELENEELKYVSASEAAAETDSVECEEEKRATHDYKELSETPEKAKVFEIQDPESLDVPPHSKGTSIEILRDNGANSIEITPDKQEPEAATPLSSKDHIVLEADSKKTTEPENSDCVTQVQQEATSRDNQSGGEKSDFKQIGPEQVKSKEEERVTNETKEATRKSLQETMEEAEHFNEGSKVVTEKEELQIKIAERNEDEAAKTDEKEEGEHSGSEAPVIGEASRDIEAKVFPKKHNILSGVGSKVKHSIAKVKKAITGKHSQSKPVSPK